MQFWQVGCEVSWLEFEIVAMMVEFGVIKKVSNLWAIKDKGLQEVENCESRAKGTEIGLKSLPKAAIPLI